MEELENKKLANETEEKSSENVANEAREAAAEAPSLDTEQKPSESKEEPTTELSEKEKRKAIKKAKKLAKKEEKRRKEEQKSFLQNLFETIFFACVVFIAAILIKTYIGQPIMVDGSSMNDTLYNHDWVWANKLFYTPERFDVVIVKNERTNNRLFIKRVIGLPGETVEIKYDDTIWINDKQIDDPYGYYTGTKTKFYGTYKLGKDEYFVMGDNRYNSTDSRIIGPFKRSEIKGHAVCRIWPFSKLGNFDKSNEK